MTDTQIRKYHLIDKIIHLENDAFLTEIEKILANIEILQKLATPTRPTVDIERLKKEQGYKGADREKMKQLVQEINITEPIEELLAQLSR